MRRPRDARRAVAITSALLLTLVATMSARAEQGAGSVTVEATNNAAITLSISDGTADFGSNIDPMGTKSNSSDANQVVDYQESGGSYYVWRSDSGNGLTVTVKSNKSWTGTVEASKNKGTSDSMSIESGVLRYNKSEPQSYYDAALSTPFSTSPTTFEPMGSKGVHNYTYFYALRVGWDDDPGTLESSVTYSVTH